MDVANDMLPSLQHMEERMQFYISINIPEWHELGMPLMHMEENGVGLSKVECV
jgi:hypothetical protein